MDAVWCLFTLENVVLTPGWDSYRGHRSSIPLISLFESSFLSDFLPFHYLHTQGLYQLCMGYYKDQFSHSLLGISYGN